MSQTYNNASQAQVFGVKPKLLEDDYLKRKVRANSCRMSKSGTLTTNIPVIRSHRLSKNSNFMLRHLADKILL
jgi:hypothetical protein